MGALRNLNYIVKYISDRAGNTRTLVEDHAGELLFELPYAATGKAVAGVVAVFKLGYMAGRSGRFEQ